MSMNPQKTKDPPGRAGRLQIFNGRSKRKLAWVKPRDGGDDDGGDARCNSSKRQYNNTLVRHPNSPNILM
jgi:hypothetical protein